MKHYFLGLSLGLLAAGSESFRSVSISSRHNNHSGISQKTIAIHSNSNSNKNYNDECRKFQSSVMKSSSNNDDMIAAQEAEARKICPLLPPPEDVHATFEAAMG